MTIDIPMFLIASAPAALLSLDGLIRWGWNLMFATMLFAWFAIFALLFV